MTTAVDRASALTLSDMKRAANRELAAAALAEIAAKHGATAKSRRTCACRAPS